MKQIEAKQEPSDLLPSYPAMPTPHKEGYSVEDMEWLANFIGKEDLKKYADGWCQPGGSNGFHWSTPELVTQFLNTLKNNNHEQQTTAMQELVRQINGAIQIIDEHGKLNDYAQCRKEVYQSVLNVATELLTKEREQIIESWQDGYVIGCSVGGNDYTTETENDTGIFYFTQTFKQD